MAPLIRASLPHRSIYSSIARALSLSLSLSFSFPALEIYDVIIMAFICRIIIAYASSLAIPAQVTARRLAVWTKLKF
jgi:hypothetical protein